jgi:hypothetical protein
LRTTSSDPDTGVNEAVVEGVMGSGTVEKDRTWPTYS